MKFAIPAGEVKKGVHTATFEKGNPCWLIWDDNGIPLFTAHMVTMEDAGGLAALIGESLGLAVAHFQRIPDCRHEGDFPNHYSVRVKSHPEGA